jgi:energy-coupling factor transporter ATP-binding protein EcfA2
LPAKAWQPLMTVLIALGIPAAAATEWRRLVARHLVIAVVLAIGWFGLVGAGVLINRALSGPARRRLEQAGNAADRAAAWWLSGYGRRYRRWVLDSRRYIEVSDLATGGDHTPELDDVYVDVALVRRAPHQVSGNPLSGVPEDAAGRHSLSDFLNRRERVVLAVVGPPGCGKSTLLAHTARHSSQAGRRNRRRVSVLIALRGHAETIAADPGTALPDVLRVSVRGVPGKEPDRWWERQLQRGRCTILLDGLDEVAREEDRRAVATWVERQINSNPGNHFVITSRPHGFPGPVIPQADILAVRPFTAEQVQLFINRWYLAAERHATGAASAAQMRAVQIRASESAARLLALLRANSALHDLTVNPLLLTMIAMVHRYRGALPGSRADLYAEICQVMVSRRIQAKDLPELMPWPSKHKLLATLAYQMMSRRVSDLPARDVLAILDPLLRRMPQLATGQAFLDDVSRNGLLVEPRAGRYAFTHLTFQEYLAARHISSNPRLAGTLNEAVDDQWWRETTLLYAATSDADQVVRACLDSSTIPALTLAFDCAEISSELALDLRQRLDHARDRAFRKNCDPEHRRLIAAVLVGRLARETIATSVGTRICCCVVPADLYWLFVQDTQSGGRDMPSECHPDQPATDIWSDEALSFLRWLNRIATDGSRQAEFRLPDEKELREKAVTDALARQLPETVTSLWTRPRRGDTAPGQWAPPRKPHPQVITGAAIQQAVMLDASKTGILVQILSAAALDLARAYATALDRTFDRPSDLDVDLYRALDLDLDRVLDLGLDRTLDRAQIQALDLSYALACDLACDLTHHLDQALDLARALAGVLARDLDRALDRDLDLDLDLDRALKLLLARARDLDRTLARTLELTRACALDRALYLDRALDLDRALNFDRALDLDFARDLDRGRDLDLDHALDLARGRAKTLDRALGKGDHRVRLFGISKIPLTWISGGPLGRVAEVIFATDLRTDGKRTFAAELLSRAGVSPTAHLRTSLNGSLVRALRDVRPRSSPNEHTGPGWDQAVAAAQLAAAIAPLLSRHQHPDAQEAARIRTAALALAADSAGKDDSAADVFRTVAATVTLLQQRKQGIAPIGESIVLALA